jgi:hypothetical protein
MNGTAVNNVQSLLGAGGKRAGFGKPKADAVAIGTLLEDLQPTRCSGMKKGGIPFNQQFPCNLVGSERLPTTLFRHGYRRRGARGQRCTMKVPVLAKGE